VHFYQQRSADFETDRLSFRSPVGPVTRDIETSQLVAFRSTAPLTVTPLQQAGDFEKQFQIVVGQGEDESGQLIRQRASLATSLLSCGGRECLWFHAECVRQAAYELQGRIGCIPSFQAEYVGVRDLCLAGEILGADPPRDAKLTQERTETSGTGHGAARVADPDRLLFSVMCVTIVTLRAAGTGDGVVAEEFGAGLPAVRQGYLRARAVGAEASAECRDSLAAQATALALWCEEAVGNVEDLDSAVAQTLRWISVGASSLANYWRAGDGGKPRIFLALLTRAIAEQDAAVLPGATRRPWW